MSREDFKGAAWLFAKWMRDAQGEIDRGERQGVRREPVKPKARVLNLIAKPRRKKGRA
jgi:hypothetical protein